MHGIVRRDRDRERPRDTSRSRREQSTTRRDRERDDRDRPRRGDDREEGRRDKDDYSRRDRDRDDYFRRDRDDRDRDESVRDRDRERYDYGRHKDLDRDDEDPRRWRDDGRWEERRRDREREGTRGWDRWEPSHDRERLDDRDGRPKRSSGRDRRGDEPREKDEKKEREKEKEPAWMETYVPTTPGGGILGAQTEGQLDGIQAWKKGLKEKEKKEKEDEVLESATKSNNETSPDSVPRGSESPVPTSGDGALDEIQLFKLMMKREAAKKGEPGSNGDASPSTSTPQPIENGASKDRLGVSCLDHISRTLLDNFAGEAAVSSRTELPAHPLKSFTPAAPTSITPANEARLLSLIASPPSDAATPSPTIPKPSTPGALDQAVSSGPRLFSNPAGFTSANQQPDRATVDLSSTVASNASQFNPPAGSRLLAFGSRAQGNAPAAPKSYLSSEPTTPANPLGPSLSMSSSQKFGGMTPPPPGMGLGAGLQTPDLDAQFAAAARATPSERSIRSFSPFTQQQPGYSAEEMQELMRLTQNEVMRRQERAAAGLGSDGGSYVDLGRASPNFPGNVGTFELTNAGVAPKGSRFAKFFDAKHRDIQPGPAMRKSSIGPGLVPTPPLPGPRAEVVSRGALGGNVTDSRAMEELFAMLQNSAQV